MPDVTEVPVDALFADLRKLAASRARMTVPQSRSGRRPMSVTTMLKKDQSGSLWKDHLPGGLADKKRPGDFPPAKLQEGRAVEREHASNPAIQTEIAMDHISEDPNYYPKLKRMEAGEKVAGHPALLAHPALAKLSFKLQGQTSVQGIPIAIENRKGSVRKGTDPDGTPWRTVYKIPYGYIKNTEGNDGEEIDAYVGPHKDAPEVYVIHQHKIDGKGYDEDKVMFGFLSEEEARKAYLAHYNKVGPKLLGPISTIKLEDLKKRLEQKRKHTKLAYITGGSGSGSTGNRMALLDMDEKPERTKPGDVPSMDGTNPGTAGIVRREAGPEMATVLPTNGAQASSQTGATTRL